MWPFNYFKKKREKEEQERRRAEEQARQQKLEEERIARERERRLEENRRKELERQAKLKAEREQKESIQPFTFRSNCHQRYENDTPVMGLQECIRTVSLVKNTDGCPGYKLDPGVGYIVKIYNDDLGKPNMSDKPMKVVTKSADMVELRGFPIEARSPFGWQEVDYSDYGFVVYYKNGQVEKCVLHMYDRNIRLEYLHSSIIKKEEPKEDDKPFNNNISISAVANGFTFNLKLPKVKVVKQPYYGDAQIIETDSSAYARIMRKETNGTVTFDISNIAELRSKRILQQNPTFVPQFDYQSQGNDFEAASAEVGNSWESASSGKEYVSLFQITQQKGKIVAFIINNLPNEDDFYYLIVFSE